MAPSADQFALETNFSLIAPFRVIVLLDAICVLLHSQPWCETPGKPDMEAETATRACWWHVCAL
jgi:hypothetical protein